MTETGKIIGLIEALGGGGGSGGGVSATVIADAFSTSKAYSAGDYVTKGDKLYVFTADHAAGAWTGADADEVTVGEELSDVKSAISPATSSKLGIVSAVSSRGVQVLTGNNAGQLAIAGANSAECKDGANAYRPVTVQRQHESVFYGLAKAAGADEKDSALSVGEYTESAKSAIAEMLGGAESVSGTTPTITAKAGVRYICGECATLGITVPASGCIDVVFESGSTPTVLTITPPTGVTVKWAGGFDPTALDANTTYEINILDGELGVAASWT